MHVCLFIHVYENVYYTKPRPFTFLYINLMEPPTPLNSNSPHPTLPTHTQINTNHRREAVLLLLQRQRAPLRPRQGRGRGHQKQGRRRGWRGLGTGGDGGVFLWHHALASVGVAAQGMCFFWGGIGDVGDVCVYTQSSLEVRGGILNDDGYQ